MYQKIIIIGAGRSGTNMLRDALTNFDSCATWPCDEINYVWRYGNRSSTNDELAVEAASRNAAKYINKKFDQLASKTSSKYIVEKTCANSLRVPFVDAIVPGSKYVNIVRDGRDVVASVLERWGASIEPAYILKKARYVPVSDVPYYATRYASHRIKKLVSREKMLPSWGPVYEGMRNDLRDLSVPEVCALQWKNCVEKSCDALAGLGDDVINIRYEEFVTDPKLHTKAIADFVNIPYDTHTINKICSGITASSIGKGVDIDIKHPEVAGIISSVNIT